MTLPKYAYATLLTNASYLIGVQVLARSLRFTGSKFPLIVLQTGLDTVSLELLHKEPGISDILEIKTLKPSDHAQTGYASTRFGEVWTKFQAWGLVQYEMICLLDADMLITRPIDSVFSHLPTTHHLAASPACTCNIDNIPSYPPEWNPHNCLLNRQTNDGNPFRALNAGLMVFRPSLELLGTMEKVLAESTDLAKYKFPEQDFLQEYYPDWVQLPWWFNGLKTLVSNHLNVWDEDKHRVIHYIKDKPWDVPPHTEKYFAHPYLRLNQWWWNAYYNDGDWRANGLERHALQQAQYAMALEE